MNNSVDNKDIATLETKKKYGHYNLYRKNIVSIANTAISFYRVKPLINTNGKQLIKVNV